MTVLSLTRVEQPDLILNLIRARINKAVGIVGPAK